jgi:hypothetical protein
MMWLMWRQHRGEAVTVAIVVVVLAVPLLVTEHILASAYQQLGVGGCLAHPDQGSCPAILGAFTGQLGSYRLAIEWLNLLPALLGMLVGAPLVARELERGTHRMVWTQGITRARWLVTKLGLVLGGSLLSSAILTALLIWWRAPLDRLQGNLGPQAFDYEGVVPLAYVAFALALGVASGVLLRKTVPAMAATFIGFVAVRLPVELLARQNYLPPRVVTWDGASQPAGPGPTDWEIGRGWIDRGGHHISMSLVLNSCSSTGPGGGASGGPSQSGALFYNCTYAHGWLQFVAWQPHDRFWLFQGIESAIFVALAAVLLGLGMWWVQRRIA